MVKLENGVYVIGFDNGYQFGKTANTLFDNGVFAMGKVGPSVKEQSLKYNGKRIVICKIRWLCIGLCLVP